MSEETIINDDDFVDLGPVYRLSTNDNPYHPIDDEDLWYRFDHEHGHCCLELTSRVSQADEGMEEKEAIMFDNAAVDEIVFMDPETYKRVIIS